MKKTLIILTCVCASLLVTSLQAKESVANLTAKPGINVSPATNYIACSSSCFNQKTIDERVHAVAELDVFKFMKKAINSASAMIVDTRTYDLHKQGTIPGSINIPSAKFEKPVSGIAFAKVLEQLGGIKRTNVSLLQRVVEKLGFLHGSEKTDQWDFSQAKNVLLWCNDAHCEQTPQAIRGLLKAGYPASKICYYRGGMQMWQSLGLAIIVPHNMRIASN